MNPKCFFPVCSFIRRNSLTISSSFKITQRWRSTSAIARRNAEYSIKVLGTGSSEVHPTLLVNCGKQSYMFNCGAGAFRTVNRIYRNPVLFLTRALCERLGGAIQLFHVAHQVEDPKNYIKYLVPSNCHVIMTDSLPRITGRYSWKKHEDICSYQDHEFRVSGVEIGPQGSSDRVVVYSCKKLVAPKTLEAADACAHNNTLSGSLEEKKGSTFMVVECPSKDHRDIICSHEKLNSHWFKDNDETLDLIVHITPFEVLDTNEYSSWMASFGDNVHHLLLHSSVCPTEVLWRKSMLFSTPLHLMNPKVYHFPQVPTTSGPLVFHKNFLKENLVIVGRSRLKLDLSIDKPLSINRSEVLKPLRPWFDSCFQLIKKSCGAKIKKYHKLIDEPSNWCSDLLSRKRSTLSLRDSNDCIVTFLGTAARNSNSFRNASGILVQTHDSGNVLLDCGESTLVQLYRCFGGEHARALLSNIQTIFISHMHPDHWFGLFEVLAAIHSVSESGYVDIIAPDVMDIHLRCFNTICKEMNYNFVDAKVATYYPHEHGRLSFKAIPVVHDGECYGVKISLGQHWNIIYSGDTRPSSRLIAVGRNTNLLIHEATFMHHGGSRHSSYGDALFVAKEMNPSFTILTHFSKSNCFDHMKMIPCWDVINAVDLMSVRLSDIRTYGLCSSESTSVFRRTLNVLHTLGQQNC